jgi:hypothetical protein
MLEDLNLNDLQNPDQFRAAIVRLLNLVEELSADNQALRAEVQQLRDENNRLKGEQGKPTIKPNQPKKTGAAADRSSEARRHKPQTWKKTSKLSELTIDREEVLKVPPTLLPPDAEFKDYVPVVVQDAHLQTETIRFLKEKYYSATTRQTYLATLPRGYQDQFGPNVKALAVVLYFAGNMSEPKLLEFFRQAGLHMSHGELSNLLIKDHADFHTEKDAVYTAGLSSSAWQNTDHTGTRVNGQNQQCQIVCNPLYTAYLTTEKKDRLSVLQVLQNNRPLTFRFNTETLELLETLKVPAWAREHVAATLSTDRELSQPEVAAWLDEQLPTLGAQHRARVLDAAAIAAYHAQVEFPVIRLLVCDDAPQFNWVTDELALCWIHEGRHYQKLEPVVPQHRAQLEAFQDDFWAFYDELLKYREHPTPPERIRLDTDFDRLFSTVTGYAALDARMAKTRAKKHCLLLVLTHPEIPLHNNPAELGARQRVRKGDVSFGPRSKDGVKAWDTFMTLVATSKKLGLSFYAYVLDRISGANQLPKLADLITERAQKDPLDVSWSSP